MRTPEDLLVVVFIVWFASGIAAAVAGPSRYSGRMFLLTWLFMGPLGIATALIAKAIEDYAPTPRNATVPPTPVDSESVAAAAEPSAASSHAPDNRDIRCSLCNAEQRVAADAERFMCRTCKEIVKVPN